jgi:acyl-CoA thioesterase I
MGFFNFKTIVLVIAIILFFNYINKDNFNEEEITSLPIDTKILAFGDSITQGYKVSKSDSYPFQLSNLLHVDVRNAGISAEVTQSGLKRLKNILETSTPDILLLCEGGNDILQKQDLKKTKNNLAKMIQLAQEKNIYVILIGVPKLGLLNLQTASLYQELADEFQIPLDTSLEDILNDSSLKVDNIHPNKKGYKILSENLAILISENYLPSYSF